ncbi:metalloregulator ArsR/SmtB family transcription factor [Rhodanobacter sp. C01]|uniref:ArsR/SmtB family transcription factor n=1 Tax=Rhodanobacter sp. C01 TaxID=1945856 RepID=UPI000984C1F7|nr:metalloregulator ArsR/SmtB family transcription factor [Rhodanobacter sp. C01]OOG49098.1 transcriptional regulator [Rhodanobacter sp. C01]
MSLRREPPLRRLKGPALREYAPTFAALGDETRLHLVAAMCVGGTMSITQLTAGTAITRQAVTRHLQILADAGLVRDVKLGRERLWALEPTRLEQARHSLDMIAQQWDHALMRLKATLEQ